MSRILAPGAGVARDLVYRFDDVSEPQGVLAMVTAQYVTGPTAGNRIVSLQLNGKSGNLIGVFASPAFQIASSTITYVWGGTGTAYASIGGAVIHIPMQNIFLLGGDLLTLEDVGFDSDDEWQPALLTVVGQPESGSG